jgi:hypothetical protein
MHTIHIIRNLFYRHYCSIQSHIPILSLEARKISLINEIRFTILISYSKGKFVINEFIC